MNRRKFLSGALLATGGALIASRVAFAGDAAVASFMGAPWPIVYGHDRISMVLRRYWDLHPKEMAPPADLAKGIREVIGVDVQRDGLHFGVPKRIELQLRALDADSVRAMIANNKRWLR